MLLGSEKAGGISTSCSDLQLHLGWSFADVTSRVALAGAGALCILHSRGRAWRDLGRALGWWQKGLFMEWELCWEPWGGWWGQLLLLHIQALCVPCNLR